MVDAREPTIHDVDALVGAATPHFAYQIRARVGALVEGLPDEHPVRRYAESRVEMLDRLGRASCQAAEGPIEPDSRIGWDTIKSHGCARESSAH
ncbi:MAG: hypothetical protein ACR2OD_01955 [Gaiellaceae bacterium]